MLTRGRFRGIQRTYDSRPEPSGWEEAYDRQVEKNKELEDTIYNLQESVREMFDFLNKKGSLYIAQATIEESEIGASAPRNGYFSGVYMVNGTLKYNGTTVVSGRQTGYLAMTGTKDRGSAYATGTITLPQLAERVGALQDDLVIHGLIGA